MARSSSGFSLPETGLCADAPVTQDRARPRLRSLGAIFFAAGLLMPVTRAFALWDDKLQLFAEEKVTHDDNIFRISKDLDPEGDTYRTTSLGFNLDAPVSRQRFQMGYTWNATRYDRFTDLDSDGHDARAIWLWQFGNDASGQLGYTETSALASFAFTQSRTPDRLKTQQAFFNAAYMVTPRWRLQAGVKGLDQTNGDPLRQIFDVNVLYTDVTASYITPANTSMGLSARTEDGSFPNPGSSADNAYHQDSVGVVADWTITGASHVSARADRVSRRYAHVPQQNFDGETARAEYDWKPTGKLSLAAVAQRDIYPYLDIGSSFVLVKGVTLRPTLSLTEKIDVLLTRPATGSSLQSGTRTSEGPRSRGVRLVELDVAAPAVARRARSRRSQEVREALRSRVVHDHAELVPYPNIELVVDTGLALVVAANNKVDVIVREGLVRPRRAANETGTGRLAVGVGTCTLLEVSRNAGPVNVHTEPVVDVLQVPPVRRAVLAAAADAEGRLVAVEEDETAARHEVARPGKRRAAYE